MDAIEREVFRELLPDIFEDLDPRHILPVLYKILPLDFCKKLRKLQMRNDRVSVFIEKAHDCMTLNQIFEAFAYQNGYTFFNAKIEDMLKQKYQGNEIYCCKKGNMFTKHRQELVEFRHTLKVYSLSGDQASFELEVNEIVNLWTDSNYRTSLSTRDHQKLADRYFFVRDAQCENMRLRYDRTLDSTNILSEILNVAPFTSNPTLTTMMYLARKGSAMIMADPSSHEKAFTQYIETAVQNTELVQSCRETGLVFYIKYNFMCLKYERSCNPEIKKSLFRIAEKAVDDFCREYEKVASDFQNIFRIKLAHLRLGIGVLGNNIEWVSITREDIREATVLLNQVKLEQLSNRWKWGFYIAKAKINWKTSHLENALHIAENAYSLVVKGNFKSEIKGTAEIIETLNLRIDGKINSLDGNKRRPAYFTQGIRVHGTGVGTKNADADTKSANIERMDSPTSDVEESDPIDGSFLDVSNMEEVDTPSTSYSCNLCNKSFKNHRNLKRHGNIHKPNTNTLRCSDCNSYFKNTSDLQKHNEEKHISNVCDVCGKCFRRLRELSQHLKTHNPELTVGTSLTCPFEGCHDKVFYRKTKYHDHLNKHTGNKPNECKEYRRAFFSRYARNEHECVCRNTIAYICDVCGKTFQHKSSLHNHTIADHNARMFLCGCGASYKYKRGLARHKQIKKHE